MSSHLLFAKRFFVTSFLVLASIAAFSQTYILNEDFSSASGTTPPEGWSNVTVTGDAEDLWRFDNAGGRDIKYPMIGTFAIFDSDNTSRNQMAENVFLETPAFDATISQQILFSFDHWFVGGDNAKASIEAYDGEEWKVVKIYTTTTENSEKEILDISGFVGGVPNSKLRFRWEGDSVGLWAIDNISIYTHRRHNGRYFQRHINQTFHSTLSLRPFIIRQRHQTYVNFI